MERGAFAVGGCLEIPILHDTDRYELVKDIGSGNFGVARLMCDKATKELVAVKYIERGEKIDENVQREIINHRLLRHPNIIRFREVMLTPTHLAIAMEYADGGELFERIRKAGRFSEDETRFFFQQLISGVSYCHEMQVCHRDLKLENVLLDGSQAPRLKISDFGYSKSSLLHSQPKSAVGTPAYIAPEVFSLSEYDGKDPDDPGDVRKIIWRILRVQYLVPEHIHITPECQDLLSQIFVANPAERITIAEIQNHAWFLKPLPADLVDGAHSPSEFEDQTSQSVDEIMRIIAEARIPAPGMGFGSYFDDSSLDLDDMDLENDADLDADSSGEFVCAI
eukprot:c24975_g1_i3 orf=298-1308(+)